nr:chromate efflux transporter [Roseibium sp. TrichSKD4]
MDQRSEMTTRAMENSPSDHGSPGWRALLRVFLNIGLLSFGGPAAQIALMHRKLVDETRWLSERSFTNALGFCMLLPGPEAMQLATYAGWRLKGVAGGLLAGLLFVLPGAAVIFLLGTIYALYGQVSVLGQAFLGIKAAVLVIVFEALLKLSRRALTNPSQWVLAGLSFFAIFFLAVPFPLIVLLAAGYGAVAYREDAGEGAEVAVTVSTKRTLATVLIGLVVWFAPLVAVGALSGVPILSEIGLFFSKLAVVTFGGAYAVLAYMAQDVVTQNGWLTAGEMMDGLGLAETTPGPLILVTQFVAFLAAFKEGGVGLALAGGMVALWATFAPCFLWIFAGAPYIEWISAQPRLKGALTAIIAAVVGVVLNLSVWFALHVLFGEVSARRHGPLTLWIPNLSSLDWRVPVITLICGLLLLRWHKILFLVLGVAAALGWGLSQV